MEMNRNEGAKRIDIGEWSLPTDDSMESLVAITKRAASETLEMILRDYPPRVFFSCLINEGDDPLMLSVDMPLSDTEQPPLWNFSLSCLIERELSFTPSMNDVNSMREIGSALRALADRIDQRIAKINIGGIA